MAVPNIEKAELHPDWTKLFDSTASLYGNIRFCLILAHEDGSEKTYCALKYEKIDGIPSGLYDIVPSKDVIKMYVVVQPSSGQTIRLLTLYPPEGENVMNAGERYTFRMFIRLKGAEWLGVQKQEGGQEQEQGQEQQGEQKQ